MEGYEHEKEQVEAIKKWWEENGKAIIVGAVIGITALVGWQSWTNYQRSISEAASAEYDQLTKAVEAGNSSAVEEHGSFIVNKYGKTPYADLAKLELAKSKYASGDAAAAQTYLQQVIDNARLPELGYIARLRLARILFADGKPDKALSQLNVTVADAFTAAFEELKGDIYAAQNERELARTAYTKALAQREPGSPQDTLQMKLDNLGDGDSR